MLHASVLIASPGTAIYSVLGHAALRLQFSDGTHTLDYTFTAEGQDVSHNVVQFFAGNLQMGVMRLMTEEYTAQFSAEGRTVTEYPLNLSEECIRTLWQQMDERVVAEANLPYDFMNRSCAQCVYQWVNSALQRVAENKAEGSGKLSGKGRVEIPAELRSYLDTHSRNEIAGEQVTDPWTHFLLQSFIGGEGYYVDIPAELKIVTPRDLITALRLEEAKSSESSGSTGYTGSAGDARSAGYAGSAGHPAFSAPEPSLVTNLTSPTAVSALLLVVSALVAYKGNRASRLAPTASLAPTSRLAPAARLVFTILMGTLFTIASLFITYLVLFSDLPCTSWHWLLIPFNPLPLLLWPWRRYWAKAYLGIVVLWCLGMALAPHHLVDTAHILLALAWAITILSTGISNRDSITRRPERPMTSVAQGK